MHIDGSAESKSGSATCSLLFPRFPPFSTLYPPLLCLFLLFLSLPSLHECLSLTVTARTYEECLDPRTAWFFFKSLHWPAYLPQGREYLFLGEGEDGDDLQTISSMVSLLQSPSSTAALDWRLCPFDDAQMANRIVHHFIEAPARLHDLLLPFTLFAMNRVMNMALNDHLDRYHPYYIILMPRDQKEAVLTSEQVRKLNLSPIDILSRTFGLSNYYARHKISNESSWASVFSDQRRREGSSNEVAVAGRQQVPSNDASSSSSNVPFDGTDRLPHSQNHIVPPEDESQSRAWQGRRGRDDAAGNDASLSGDESENEHKSESESEGETETETDNEKEPTEMPSLGDVIEFMFLDFLAVREIRPPTLNILNQGFRVDIPEREEESVKLSREARSAVHAILYSLDTDQWLRAYWRLDRLLEEELSEYSVWRGHSSRGKLLYCAIFLGMNLVHLKYPNIKNVPGAENRRPVSVRISSEILATLLSTFLCSGSTLEEIPPTILHPLWRLACDSKLWLKPPRNEQPGCQLFARLEFIQNRIFPLLKGPNWGDLPACIDRWRRSLRLLWGISAPDFSSLEVVLENSPITESFNPISAPIPLADIKDENVDKEEVEEEEENEYGEQRSKGKRARQSGQEEDEPGRRYARVPLRLVLDPSDAIRMKKMIKWWLSHKHANSVSPLLNGHPLRQEFLNAMTIFLEEQLRQDTPFIQTALFQRALTRTTLANLLHYHQITLVGRPKSISISPWPLGMYYEQKEQNLLDMFLNMAYHFARSAGSLGLALRQLRAPFFLPLEAMEMVSFNTWGPTSLEGQPDLSSQPIAIHGVAKRGQYQPGKRYYCSGAISVILLLLFLVWIASTSPPS